MFDSVAQFFEGIQQNFEIIISNQGILEERLISLYNLAMIITISTIATALLMIIFASIIISKQSKIIKETSAIADEVYSLKEYFKNQEVQQLRLLAAKGVNQNGNIDQ